MDIAAELKKWGVEVHDCSTELYVIRCPYPGHEDKNPSCQVVKEDTKERPQGHYFCPVCKKGGDFYHLLEAITKTPASAHRYRYEGPGKKISPKKIEAYFACLNNQAYSTASSETLKRELLNRGLKVETLKKYLIGFDSESKRITIPIQWGDDFINVMKYLPGADQRKFENYGKGYGKHPALYPQEQLKYDKIVLCGGPMKALVVAQEMNPLGIGAVSSCFGEAVLPMDLIPWFKGKHVWVCFDIDKHGRMNADQTCGLLHGVAEWTGDVLLPLNEYLYPKGDVNDYFGAEASTAEDYLHVLEECPRWEDTSSITVFNVEEEEVPLEKLCGFSKPFNFSSSAYLSGVDDSTAHKVPKSLKMTCSGDAECCALCRLRRRVSFDPLEGHESKIDPRNPLCLSFVNIPHRMRSQAFKDYFGIPEMCGKCMFETSEELYTVRYVLLSDTSTDSELPISAVIYTDGEELHTGEVCRIRGRADQSPLTSEELRIVIEHEPRDILSTYVIRNTEMLDQFRPKNSTTDALREKIEDLCLDLERNVTFIYDRPQIHTLFDLTYHSPLWIPFENSIEPGWISVLLVSETAQGKSTIMRRLMDHYGHGTFIDAANTSVAGLVGGIKTVGKRQFVKWGILPQMDKRLVCIEEYANAPVELLRSMRAARDSGVVCMNKIDRGRAKARTRTIVLSNPKKLIKPNVVIDGISMLEDLVERPEDLRRFDAGMWIPRIELEEWHEASAPKYPSEACHELITWAWTLPVENIVFDSLAAQAVRSNRLKDKYPFLYLVGRREFDVKLARLATAVACRTYNMKEGKLVVELQHVRWVTEFLQSLYDDVEFGYTSRIRRETDMDQSCCEDSVLAAIKLAGNPNLLCDYLMQFNRYQQEDFRAACGDSFSFEQAKNKLIILGCVVGEEDTRYNNAYLPTRRLKKVLPKVKEDLGKQYNIPAHLRQGQESF